VIACKTAIDKPHSMRYHPASEFPDMVARIAGVSSATPTFRCVSVATLSLVVRQADWQVLKDPTNEYH
jgi:hypothetical protein